MISKAVDATSLTSVLTIAGKCQIFASMANDRCNLGAPAFDSSNGALFEQFFCDSLASCFQFLDLDLCRHNDLIPQGGD